MLEHKLRRPRRRVVGSEAATRTLGLAFSLYEAGVYNTLAAARSAFKKESKVNEGGSRH